MALANLQQVQVHDGNEATFATDLAGSFSGLDVRLAGPAKIDMAQAFTRDPSVRQRLEETHDMIALLKSGTRLTLPTFLRGTGTAAGDATAAVGAADLAESRMLVNAFGGESLGTGTTVNDAGASATEFTVTSAAGLAVGQALLVTLATGLEASVIGAIATNDITLTRALSAAPANGAVVYASATYYPIQVLANTIQFDVLTAGAASAYYRALGCQLTPKLSNLIPPALPLVTYEAMAASWAQKTGGALALASYGNASNPPIPGYASSLYLGTVAATTRTLTHFSALDIDPGLGVVGIPSGSGTEGLQGYSRTAMLPTVKLTLNEWTAATHDLVTAQTNKFLHYQIGATAGQTVLIEIPNMVATALPEAASVANSQLGQSISFEGHGTGSTETDIARAPIRIHLL